MLKTLILVSGLLIALTGCRIPETTPTPPESNPTATIEAFTPTPEPTPRPPPTIDFDAMIQAALDRVLSGTQSLTGDEVASPIEVIPTETPEATSEATPAPTPTATPVPAPTATPVPTSTPIIRAVSPPLAASQVLKVGSISMQGDVLRLSGTIEGQSYSPSAIQVWHAYDAEPYSLTCSTERPVAFVQPGNGSTIFTGSSSPYTWTFCRNGYSNTPQTDNVPWVYSQSWSYELRKRDRITDPWIYDFSAVINLDSEQIEQLRYSDAVALGWRVIVFSGSEIIASQWLDY